ncbi:MAG: lamin tail domain-containing protein, partial [Bacillus sp. (in: Bacteria)]|nr:lamin tail domain-containing protein [Bacillus sp. (in: firmicutes)]
MNFLKNQKVKKIFKSAMASLILAGTISPYVFVPKAFAEVTPADHVVISEVYGGGGNSGAEYKNDFIELYNPTNQAVSLEGWSVQYASSTGKFTSNKTELSGEIKAKGYYLIQQAQGTGGTLDLPAPDAIGTIGMAGTNGKVALVKAIDFITGQADSNVVDFVGFGSANEFETAATPVLTNTTSAQRINPNVDTDNNSVDFMKEAPIPQNSTSVVEVLTNHLVISEVYGGGGNAGAEYKNDFIELYNPTNEVVSLA